MSDQAQDKSPNYWHRDEKRLKLQNAATLIGLLQEKLTKINNGLNSSSDQQQDRQQES